MKQLDWQRRGLADPEAAKAIGLSKEQVKGLGVLEENYKKDLAAVYKKIGVLDSKARAKAVGELREALADKQTALLDQAQQQDWKDMAGNAPLVTSVKVWRLRGILPAVAVTQPTAAAPQPWPGFRPAFPYGNF